MDTRLADIDFSALTAGRTFFASPAAWEDEVLYFLMLDRSGGTQRTGRRADGASGRLRDVRLNDGLRGF